ncbi:hypothetical protein JX266_002674 [Neoarthrinium moseri]|uniref:uncharacterized protein n=1 Tax=Neoarthrinium moseri TaxID=1658444 RepID=UPI001FDDDE78|nr:uncharacterized protein JN550_005112 [Neoarthrinium moseri]KAI1852496.1 hypothetical protein JX266_002674 [Neoarthrinium moseri]KAI1870569.1 hypothetical protein JN550_005112 [Neoarthrinium moseri]
MLVVVVTDPPQLSPNVSSEAHGGPPYAPTTALVGGVPTVPIDDPVSAVLLALFLISAAAHMYIFQTTKRRGHLFVFSAMMFAFSMIRAAALVLRLIWASNATNVRMAMAANILTQAGTVIVFIVNLFFAQRILRAYHPHFGWSTPARVIFRFLIGCVIGCLIMVIAVTVQSFYTLDGPTRDADRKVQLFAGTYLAVLAFLPIPVTLLAATISSKFQVEKFGEGPWRTKLVLLVVASMLLTAGAGFRVGTNFSPRPMNNPAWYHTRAPYYVFNFGVDLIVSYLYIIAGVHRRFFVPNGAKGPGSYMATLSEKESSSSSSIRKSRSKRKKQGTGEGAARSSITKERHPYADSAWDLKKDGTTKHYSSGAHKGKGKGTRGQLPNDSQGTFVSGDQNPDIPHPPSLFTRGLRYPDLAGGDAYSPASHFSGSAGSRTEYGGESAATTDIDLESQMGSERGGIVLADMLDKMGRANMAGPGSSGTGSVTLAGAYTDASGERARGYSRSSRGSATLRTWGCEGLRLAPRNVAELEGGGGGSSSNTQAGPAADGNEANAHREHTPLSSNASDSDDESHVRGPDQGSDEVEMRRAAGVGVASPRRLSHGDRRRSGSAAGRFSADGRTFTFRTARESLGPPPGRRSEGSRGRRGSHS